MQRPALVTHKDAHEPQSQKQGLNGSARVRTIAQRPLASLLSSLATRTPNSAMPTILPLAAQQ